MNKRKVLSTLIMSVCILAGVTAAFGQGRYGNVYSRNDVSGFIQNLENSSDNFSRDFQNAGGTSNSERRVVERFENAVDRLRSNFDRNQTWWNSRNDIQGIMTEARQVNSMMNNERYARRLEQQWRALRRDINKLAETFELPGLAGGGNGGGGWNNDGGGWNNSGGGGGWNLPGQISSPPAWARGTFYSTSGPRIVMTIDNGGRITLNNEGGIYYGRYNRGQMYLNNDVSTVSRSGNGITTYNRSTGQTTFYSRDTYGGDSGGYDNPGYNNPGYNNPGYNNPGYNNPGYNDGGSNDGGPVSSPPNWAVGVFYAEGSDLQMMIENNGRVIVNNSGQSYVGRFYNGQIYLNNDVSTISRSGRNGLSTYNQSSGQTTVYRRR